MDFDVLDILIVGVGGQGTLLASRVLGRFAELNGLDCKLSEVHGMAQRGGSVVTHVKIGEKVYSPLVEEGHADIVLAFEELEALRWAHYVKMGGTVIVNVQRMMPMPVVTGACKYTENIFEKLSAFTRNVVPVHALEIAEKAATIRSMNTVMLAQLAKRLGLDKAVFRQALLESVPAKTVEANRAAFEAGYEA